MAEKNKKTPATPEQKARRKATRLIGFTEWRQTWRTANPEATKEERKKAWAAARKASTKSARKTLKALEKGGFKVVTAET